MESPPAASSSGQTPALLKSVTGALANSAAAQCYRGNVRIEVLFSVPRQARDLYPHAHVDARDVGYTSKATAIEAYVEHVFMTASYVSDEDGEQDAEAAAGSASIHNSTALDEKGKRRQGTLIYALECFLYTLPKHKAALLYVSKLDSTGWGPQAPAKHLLPYLRSRRTSTVRLEGRSSPRKSKALSSSPASSSQQPLEASTSITRVMTEAFLLHFASLNHWRADVRLPRVQHLSLHILARAQGAYLFPSSNENPRKHILSDGALIKWWRAVVTSVTCRVRRLNGNQRQIEVQPFYLVPGYDRLESHILLPLAPARDHGQAKSATHGTPLPTGIEALAEAGWIYGHPYSRKGANLSEELALPPLPLQGPFYSTEEEATSSSRAFDHASIATLIPYFPDDPKSRFISELARDAHENVLNGPPSKRMALESKPVATSSPRHVKDEDTDADSNATPPPGSGAATPRRRGKRGRSAALSGSPSPVKLSSAQRLLMKERSALDNVTADEFWTRMAFRQECCSGNAVGVFVALFTQHIDSASVESSNGASASLNSTIADEGTSLSGFDESSARRVRSLPGQPLSLPHNILREIIFKRLMIDACDWSKRAGSFELTRNFESAVGHAIQRKGSMREYVGAERAAHEQMFDDAGLVGRGIVWDQVGMSGPTSGELDVAERRWKADGATSAQHELNSSVATGPASVPAANATAQVNTLTVKRRKKV